MINKQLLDPKSIVVIGGSNDITKPGGKVLKNILDGHFQGQLYVVNPKETLVQGITSYNKAEDLPDVELAIIAVAAKFTLQVVQVLTEQKNTKAFIILSAGFSEEGPEGKALEEKVVAQINKVKGVLIGPNCVGVLTPSYHGVFTEPIPKLDTRGIDFISGSGATAVFTVEAGLPKGLTFSTIFSVGNSAQVGVEDLLKYFDETFDPATSSRIKLLYMENVNKPEMLMKHAASLIRKGCKIAAVKAGTSEAGSRAASSHTGALANSDIAVEALFKKAGIVRCYGRDDIATVACVFNHPEMKGKNMGIITHAGGPAVMLTDVLSHNGFTVPHLTNEHSKELLSKLFHGSSAANPVDILATGTAEQLGIAIDYMDKKFDEIDGIVVIFGTPGLAPVYDAYNVIHEKIQTCSKPIYFVMPSLSTAKAEIDDYKSKGHIFFPDEVNMGIALRRVYNTPKPFVGNHYPSIVDEGYARAIIDSAEDGYLSPVHVQGLLDAAGIPRAGEAVVMNAAKAAEEAKKLGYPLVMKVIGPVHKSDVGGVVLNVKNEEQVAKEFERMMKIKDVTGILLQPMLSGTELYIGASFEPTFGHLILCGLGGIFIEVLKDISAGLVPICKNEAKDMIKRLKSYKIIEGTRGKEGIDENHFADIIVQLSALLKACPEIMEIDINPLLAKGSKIIAVDARIRIEKKK